MSLPESGLSTESSIVGIVLLFSSQYVVFVFSSQRIAGLSDCFTNLLQRTEGVSENINKNRGCRS